MTAATVEEVIASVRRQFAEQPDRLQQFEAGLAAGERIEHVATNNATANDVANTKPRRDRREYMRELKRRRRTAKREGEQP
jgi:hypothetical protein